MTLFTTPASTTPMILQMVSDNLAHPGLFGLTIAVVGLVATLWIIELIVHKFSPGPRVYDDELTNHDDDT